LRIGEYIRVQGHFLIHADRLFSFLEFQFDPSSLAIDFLVAGQTQLLAGVQGGQRIRQHQPDPCIQIAALVGVAQVGHPFSAQAETPPGVGAGRDRQDQRPLRGGNADFTAGNGGEDIDRRLEMQVVPFALEV
jgi:hypothetical protein